jgi:hypothetical protein
MLDILEIHLKSAASPELADSITKACELFESYELPGYQDVYTDLLLSSDNADPGDLNTDLINLTVDMQLMILEQLLILIDGDLTVRQGNIILNAMKSVETTEFNSQVISLCSEVDTDEALCEILSLVSGEPVENFYPLISNIDQCVLDKIKMVCQQNQFTGDTINPIDIGRVRQLVDRLIKYKDFTGNRSLFIYEFILSGQLVDLPFKTYYNDIWESIAALTPNEKAIELFAVTLVSSDSNNNPKELISEMLSKTYTSADEVTPIIAAFENIAFKFRSNETSNVVGKI